MCLEPIQRGKSGRSEKTQDRRSRGVEELQICSINVEEPQACSDWWKNSKIHSQRSGDGPRNSLRTERHPGSVETSIQSKLLPLPQPRASHSFTPQGQSYQGGLATLVRQDVKQRHLRAENMEGCGAAGGGNRRLVPIELLRPLKRHKKKRTSNHENSSGTQDWPGTEGVSGQETSTRNQMTWLLFVSSNMRHISRVSFLVCLSVFACTPVHNNSLTTSTDSLACIAGAFTKQLSVLPLSKHLSHTCLTSSSSTRVFHSGSGAGVAFLDYSAEPAVHLQKLRRFLKYLLRTSLSTTDLRLWSPSQSG